LKTKCEYSIKYNSNAAYIYIIHFILQSMSADSVRETTHRV